MSIDTNILVRNILLSIPTPDARLHAFPHFVKAEVYRDKDTKQYVLSVYVYCDEHVNLQGVGYKYTHVPYPQGGLRRALGGTPRHSAKAMAAAVASVSPTTLEGYIDLVISRHAEHFQCPITRA